MYIENRLTDADLQRAHDKSPVPPLPTLLAASYLSLLEAIDIFTRESINRLTTTLLRLTLREKVILGLYYRSIGFCRSAIELKDAVHQQTLTSAERSVIELYVDMELVHRNAIPDAVEKVIAFTDWQKLRAARRIDKYFTDNPGLDTQPSKAAPHRDFIKNETARIERDVERLWGKGAKPAHWSSLNLLDRSTKLDKKVELLVIKDYDRRNFAVHTGLAGVLNLCRDNFEAMRDSPAAHWRMRALADVNALIAKAGHKDARYRLYKVAGKQSGTYAYLWESTWTGGDVYTKVHQSPEWQAVNKKHQGLDAPMKDEIYNRCVEVVARRPRSTGLRSERCHRRRRLTGASRPEALARVC